jgi:predicted ATPase
MSQLEDTAQDSVAFPDGVKPRTPLIARQRERETVSALLARDDVRLVTITGPGGVGKTRLALAVVEVIGGHFPDGVAIARLAPVRASDLVLPTIAAALGVNDAGETPLLDLVARRLHDRRLRLVLDNLEHLPNAAMLVRDLLDVAPRLSILATSRVRLRVYGEHVLQTPPLATPEPESAHDANRIGEYDAVALFVQRARQTARFA